MRVAPISTLSSMGSVAPATGINAIGSRHIPRITFAVADETYMWTPLSVAAIVKNKQVQKTNRVLNKFVSINGESQVLTASFIARRTTVRKKLIAKIRSVNSSLEICVNTRVA